MVYTLKRKTRKRQRQSCNAETECEETEQKTRHDGKKKESLVRTGGGIAMGPDMLLHIVLARKRLVADGTQHTLLAGMFLAMTSCMTRGGEGSQTVMAGCIGTGVFILPDASTSTTATATATTSSSGRGLSGLRRRRLVARGGLAGTMGGGRGGSGGGGSGGAGSGSRDGGEMRFGLDKGATAARGIVEGGADRGPRRDGSHGVIRVVVGEPLGGRLSLGLGLRL